MSVVRILNATVIYPSHPLHKTRQSFDIVDGTLQKVSSREADKIFDDEKMILCPGFFDFHFRTGEPGHEFKETLRSGSQAAHAGGFTDVLLMPNQTPTTDQAGSVLGLKEKTQHLPVNFHIAAALSEKRAGEHLSEFYDMHSAGAIAFTDDKRGIQDAGLLQRSLLYKKSSSFPILVYSDEKVLAHDGVMNEGVASTKLGLKGRPGLSEEVHVARNLQIARYCETSIHLSHISTARSVELIRDAKKDGIPVTCSVSLANLLWNEESLSSFDTNYKVLPPLRSEKDRMALIEGVNDGTIDIIASDHSPQSTEEKFCEFDFAEYGMATIQAFFPLYQTYLADHISIETLVEKVAINPKAVLGLPLSSWEINSEVSFSLLLPEQKIVFDKTNWKSASKNFTAFGKELTGLALAIR